LNEQQLTKRQERAAATAEQLLVAARDVFEARGYQATTVGAITERASCAHGTFYLYFRNKEDAFGKVITDVIHRMYERAAGPPSDKPYPALHEVIRGYLQIFAEHAPLMRCIHEAMLQSVSIREMWLDLRRPFIELIGRVLARLVETGDLRPLDTTMAAHALGSMVEWTSFTHLVLGEPPVTPTSVEDLATTLTDLWWHAIYTAPVAQSLPNY
jgi:AcrR family transcriptional regulator